MGKQIHELRGADAGAVIQIFKAVATDEGALALHEIHEKTLKAIAAHVFHTPVALDDLPDSFGDALETVEGDELRREVVHMASVLPYLETDDLGARGEALGRLARAWGVSDLTVRGALALARGRGIADSSSPLPPKKPHPKIQRFFLKIRNTLKGKRVRGPAPGA